MVFYRHLSLSDPNQDADVKRVWELNRHQYLVTLAQAYFLTGRQQYAERAVHLIESWIAGNPPYIGVNWKEGLEEALRLFSWLWTLRMIADAGILNDEINQRIVASIVLQRDHIERHLSSYSSPNTHLLGEALGLLAVGLVFPMVEGAKQGANTALRILEEQLYLQVGEDGSDREKSAYYHCYALDMYLLATVLGKQNGIQFTRRWMSRVEKMAEFLLAILRPDGSLARFGDDDGGRTVRLAAENYYDPRALLGVAAVLFERGDFKRAAGELPEEVFWILGSEGAKSYQRLTPMDPTKGYSWFGDTQLAVLRTGWGQQDSWLSCQIQPMGMLTAGHSHAAPLSYELFLGGEQVIIDPGTFTYAANGPWRDHFRGMAAHNTVQLGGDEPFVPEGPFQWRKSESLEPMSPCDSNGQSLKVGYHLGQATEKELKHIRTFEFESPQALSVHDQFNGPGRRQLKFWLHFAPGCRVRQKGASEFEIELRDTTVELALSGFDSFQWHLWEGSDDPIAGWFSPCYDTKVPAPTLCIECESDLPARRTLRLTLQPFTGKEPLPTDTSRQASGAE
jgi:hypothetical protein